MEAFLQMLVLLFLTFKYFLVVLTISLDLFQCHGQMLLNFKNLTFL